jgi:polar amino acid transport system substrate-binding protein
MYTNISLIIFIILITILMYILIKAIKQIKYVMPFWILSIFLLLSTGYLMISDFGFSSSQNKTLESQLPAKIKDRLIVGVITDNPPFTYKNANSILSGFEIDLIKELSKRLKKKAIFIELSKEKVLNYIKEGKIDIAIGGIRVSKDIKETYTFSDSYIYSSLNFFRVQDNSTPTSILNDSLIQDVRSKKIGVIEGSAANYYLNYTLGNKNNIIIYKTNEELLLSVLSNKVTYIILDNVVFKYYQKQDKYKNLEIIGQNINSTYLAGGISILMQDNSVLKKEIDLQLSNLKKEGIISNLSNIYFGEDLSI